MTAEPAPAIRVVHVSIDVKPETLVVFDAHRRTYLGLSRKGDYFHCIRPARPDDPTVQDGKVIAGDLTCSCPAGVFARRCYWTQLAEALEHGDIGFVVASPDPEPDDIAWMHEAAPGEIVEVMGR